MAVPQSAICSEQLIKPSESLHKPSSRVEYAPSKLVCSTDRHDSILQPSVTSQTIPTESEISIQQPSVPHLVPTTTTSPLNIEPLLTTNQQDDNIATCNIHGDVGTCEVDSTTLTLVDGSDDDVDQTNDLASIDVISDNEDISDDKVKRKELKRLNKERPKPSKFRPKPNAFVAVQISSPIIREKLQRVQQSMCKYDKALETTLTSLKQLHITLMVMRLDNDEDIERYNNEYLIRLITVVKCNTIDVVMKLSFLI